MSWVAAVRIDYCQKYRVAFVVEPDKKIIDSKILVYCTTIIQDKVK